MERQCGNRPTAELMDHYPKLGKRFLLTFWFNLIDSDSDFCDELLPNSGYNLWKQEEVHFWSFVRVEQGKKKMHWLPWNWLSSRKFLRGLGFRDIQLFNKAMGGAFWHNLILYVLFSFLQLLACKLSWRPWSASYTRHTLCLKNWK
jgi:hypothetical protein